MRTIQIILTVLALSYAGIYAKAQNTSDSVTVKYKTKTVIVKPQGDESYTTIKFKDTSINKKIIVKVAVIDDDKTEKKLEDKLDSGSKKVFNMIRPSKDSKKRKHLVETSFFPTFDIGFASTINTIENSHTYTPKLSKSINIDLGIIRQNINLLRGQLLLSYALNINNYYLKYAKKQEIQFINNDGVLDHFIDTVNVFYKNRLDVRYMAIPVLLEYHSKKNKFNIAAGFEFGFNGLSKVTQKGEKDGYDFQHKNDNNIKINPIQMNAVFKIGMDNIAIFAKYGISEMYSESAYESGTNPQQHLYSFGICIFGI